MASGKSSGSILHKTVKSGHSGIRTELSWGKLIPELLLSRWSPATCLVVGFCDSTWYHNEPSACHLLPCLIALASPVEAGHGKLE